MMELGQEPQPLEPAHRQSYRYQGLQIVTLCSGARNKVLVQPSHTVSTAKWPHLLLGSKLRLVPETIESGPLCITDLFQNKYVAYF